MRGARSASTFCSTAFRLTGAARQPARAGEDQQVADDFRGAVGFAVDRLHLAAQLLRETRRSRAAARGGRARPAAGCSARARCRRRTGRAPPAFPICVSRLPQLLALGLEPGLRRQVARDEDAADALALVIEQVGDGDHERPLQHRVDDLAGDRRVAVRPARRRRRARRATRQLRADELGERPVEQLLARAADAGRERLVDVDDAAARDPRPRPGARSNRTCSRARAATASTSSSSCMFSIALDSWRPSSSARSSRSSSPPVSTRTPSKTIVPSARRQPRSGTVTIAVAASSGGGTDLGARRGACATAAGDERIVGADARRRARRRPDPTRPAARDDARADRGSRPTCDRRRTAGWRRGRRCRGRPPGSASPTGSRRTRRAARGDRAAARRSGGGGTARAP